MGAAVPAVPVSCVTPFFIEHETCGPDAEPIAMIELLQHLINTFILGSTYALLGIGLTLIFGIMRVVNFAHGELYSFGAYILYMVAVLLGLNFFVALVVAIAAGCLLGALIEVVLLRPMRGAD